LLDTASPLQTGSLRYKNNIAKRGKSDYQILAHFAKRAVTGAAAHVGGRAAELAAEGVGEVAVAGKTEFEGERGEIVRALGQSVERSAKTQES